MSIFDRPMFLPPSPQWGTVFVPRLPEEPADEPIGQSYLGTPIMSNLVFLASPDTPENQDLMINTVLFEVDIIKNVVMTPISGRDGTVKEYINRDDYQILIQGMIVSEFSNVFPRDEVTALSNLLNVNKSLAIASEFLQVFPIHNIVVLHAKIAQQMGYRNQVPFFINAVSDVPIELKEF